MDVNIRIEFIASGTVTSPRGFYAGATYAGIKKKTDGVLDLAILFSEVPCVATALFTNNRMKAAPVLLCQQRLKTGRAAAVVVNSGCANAFTGKAGLADAAEMADLAATGTGVPPEDVPKQPPGLARSSEGSKAYVGQRAADSIAIVDTGAKKLVKSEYLGKRPDMLAISPDGKTLYVTIRSEDKLVLVSTSDLSQIAEIKTGKQPHGVAYRGD